MSTGTGSTATARFRCGHHVRHCIAATGLNYGSAAREAFALAHPALFGNAYYVTLRGYERWLARRRVTDSLETFVRYLASRHERWLANRTPAFGECVEGARAPTSRQVQA
jgi:hypothetical protein